MRSQPIIVDPSELSKLKSRLYSGFQIAESGCWIWTKSKDSCGYGHTSVRKRIIKAHRLSWIIHFGPIPELTSGDRGVMQVCHSCDVPACVNPNHLFLGSARDNARDADSKGRRKGCYLPTEGRLAGRIRGALIGAERNRTKRFCKNGHEFTVENTQLGTRGKRICRRCQAIWAAGIGKALS